MSADFDKEQSMGQYIKPDDLSHCLLTDVTNNFKRDRFELLSAYLDGEVTADERRQVEHWLEVDPMMQRLQGRLLALRHSMQTLAMKQPPSCNTEETVQQVMSRLERRPRHLVAIGGLATVAAVFIGAVLASSSQMPTKQFAEIPTSTAGTSGLMIALDSPVIEIPHVTKSTSPSMKQ